MVMISAASLAKICARCSGHAMRVAIDGATPEDIAKVLKEQGIEARVLDAQDPKVFDDKGPTIVSGMENLSQTAFACLISQMNSLRFREILLFPTKLWFQAEEGELTFWERMTDNAKAKFLSEITAVDVEGF